MPNDVPDWTQPVNVTGGTVAISGTATVAISGTPTVNIAGGQSVAISGTPTVQFAAGQSVQITSGSVAITAGQNGVNLSIDSPPVLLGTITVPAGSTTGQLGATLPANATGIMVMAYNASGNPLATASKVQIIGANSGIQYAQEDSTLGGVFSVPIPGTSDNPITVNYIYNHVTGGSSTVVGKVYALIGSGIQYAYAPPNNPVHVSVGSISRIDKGGAGVIANGGVSDLLTGIPIGKIYGWIFEADTPVTPNSSEIQWILLSDPSGSQIAILDVFPTLGGAAAGRKSHVVSLPVPFDAPPNIPATDTSMRIRLWNVNTGASIVATAMLYSRQSFSDL